MQRNMENLEITDHVSRLFTLLYGLQRTREEIARCEAERLPFAALLMGVDAFKEYNDRCGHDLGDRSLAEIGEIVKSRAARRRHRRSATAAGCSPLPCPARRASRPRRLPARSGSACIATGSRGRAASAISRSR